MSLFHRAVGHTALTIIDGAHRHRRERRLRRAASLVRQLMGPFHLSSAKILLFRS
jgi:hypothetical protein